MMTAPDELEERLTETLRTVADRTEPISPNRGRYRDYDHRTGIGRSGYRSGRSRSVWLAAAAAVTVGIGAIGFAAADRTETTEAAGTGQDLVLPDDGPLFLLPPSDLPLSQDVEIAAGEAVVDEGDRSAMAIGRRTGGGFEDVVVVFHSTATGGFAVDEATAETVAGRQLFDSFDEGVVEPLADGSWIVYQTEFNDPQLVRLVAATSIVDGRLAFADPEGVLETIAYVDDADGNEKTTVASLPTSDSPPGPGGPVEGFVLVTATPTTTGQELYYGAAFGAQDLQRVTTDRVAGEVHIGRPTVGVTVVAWSPAPNTAAAMMVFGGSEEDVIDFVAGMRIVDRETWEAELS